MKQNVASQAVGCQMTTASDGSDFTSAVTVYVTGDNGTQAVGSVGSGACTHEGNGYHSYAPAQAETNYAHVAFTFKATGAITSTVQIYTSFPQTGDNYARIGAPAGASVSADIAAVKAQTAAIEVDTQDIQARLPAALVSGRMDSSVGAVAANAITAASISTDAGEEIADAILNRDMATGTDSGSSSVRTVRQALRALRNKWTNAAGAYTVYKEDDSTSSWTSTLTTDAAAVPIITSDPA